VSGGSMLVSTSYLISYHRSPLALDISSLNALRINQVEHPMGMTPQQMVNFEIIGDFMYLTSRPNTDLQKQAPMTDKDHYAISYCARHTVPSDSSSGTYSRALDTAVFVGSMAYSLLMKSRHHENNAIARIETASNLLEDVVDYLTALTDSSAAAIKSTTSAMRTAVTTALDAANAYLDQIGVATTGDLALALAVWDDQVKHILTSAGIPNAEDYIEAAKTAISAGDSYLTGSSTPSMKAYLQDGGDSLTAGNDYLTSDTAPSSKKYITDGDDLLTTLLDYITGSGTVSAKTFLTSGIADIEEADTYLTGTDLPSLKKYMTTIDALWTATRAWSTGDTWSTKTLLQLGDDAITLMRSPTDFITGATAPAMKKYLDDGDAKIETVNVAGQQVAALYVEYSSAVAKLVGALQVQSAEYAKYAELADKIYQGILGEMAIMNAQAGTTNNIAVGLQNKQRMYVDYAAAAVQIATTLLSTTGQYGNYAQVCTTVAQLLNQTSVTYTEYAKLAGEIANQLGIQSDRNLALANGAIAMSKEWANKRLDIITVAGRRSEAANVYVNEAQARLALVKSYQDDATAWDYMVDRLLADVTQQFVACEREHEIAEKLKVAGEAKRAEFWNMLQEAVSGRLQLSTSARHQSSVR